MSGQTPNTGALEPPEPPVPPPDSPEVAQAFEAQVVEEPVAEEPVTDERWAPIPPTKPAATPLPPLTFAPPRSAGAVAFLGVVLSLVVIGIAVVLIHDGLVGTHVVDGESWVAQAADSIGMLGPSTGLAWIGIGAAVVGLLMVIGAVLPRRAYGMRLRAGDGVYVLEQDVARLASGVARRTGGVLQATSGASRRTVVVKARTSIDQDVSGRVEVAVADRLAALERPPKVRVHTKGPRP